MMALRPVKARAARTAYISASVPDLAKRTWSISNRSQKRSAISDADGAGVTKSVPVCRACCTAAITVGLRWPTSMAPKPIDRSSRRRPSTSVSQAPLADTTDTGWGSQYWKDDGTPRGNVRRERTLSAPDSGVLAANLSHSAASSVATRSASSGV